MVLASTLTVQVDSILDSSSSAQEHDLKTALEGLQSLQSFQVNTELLSETQAGKKVRKLTKHSNEDIAQAAQQLINSWKDCVRQEQEQQPSSAPEQEPQPSQSKKRPRSDDDASDQQKRSADLVQRPVKQESIAQMKAALPKLGDPVRQKTAEMMLDGLHTAQTEGAEGDPIKVAAEIEQAVYLQNGGVTASYKTKVRSLAFNMRDARNPDLRRRVLEGTITGHVLVTLSSDELASDDRRKENKEIREHAMWEANPAAIKKATTDAFQCSKCKQKKCIYYQMQTRSADEPMTTFVTCTVCNNRWKFS